MANRPRITDPIEWIKDVIATTAEGSTIAASQRNDAARILEAAEAQRLRDMSDDDLANMILKATGVVDVKVGTEMAKRLAAYASRPASQPLPAPGTAKAVTANDGTPVILPEGYHLMTGVNLPVAGIPCGCKYGTNHSEEFFEVEPGGEPPVSGNTGIEGFEDPYQEAPAETEPVPVLEKKE